MSITQKEREKLEEGLRKDLGGGTMAEIPVRGFLSTGSISLDYAIRGQLWDGGYPRGRIVELYGDPSTGKSLLIAHAIANAQKLGWYVIYDDAENSLDSFFMQKLGVRNDLSIVNSETIEGHVKRVSRCIKKIREADAETPILICLDSLAALSTTHERGSPEKLEADVANEIIPDVNLDKRDMTKAQLIRGAMRVLASRFMKEDVLYICTNHVTQKIGVMYGPTTTTPGGTGVKFHASVRIDLNKGKKFENNEGPTGHQIYAEVTKNKVAPPYKKVNFNMFFASGVDLYSGTFDILQKMGIVSEGGGWYTTRLTGKDKFRSKALETPEMMGKLITAVREGKESIEVADDEEKKED